jgi:D-serine deaminase-like pyridoxal phosphate-dependent protein
LRRDDLQTPALLIRLDRVRTNLQHMREQLGGDLRRWRPHVKTAKVPEVLDLLLAAPLRHFKCATTREAMVFLERAERGEPRDAVDLLIAYPHRGANLRRVADLARAFPRHSLSLLSEDAAHAAEIRALGDRIGIFLDIDPGYQRTGIPLEDRDRIRATARAAGDALLGLHYYDGHLHSGSMAERRHHCDRIYGELLRLVDEMEFEDPELITSGTPTYQQALEFSGFAGRRHRVSPGTVVYSDVRTEELGIRGFARAVHVLSRVVSARAGRITCDAGSKSLDAAAGDPCAVAEGWPGLSAQAPSEEHLPLRVDAGATPAVGALLELAPRHVCPTVNLADEAVLMEGDAIVGVVPVAARGHETCSR